MQSRASSPGWKPGLPHRLLPFAVGEHDDEYSALDLSRPDGEGDYAVVVAFHGRGEGWVTYPSSAAWLAADGVTTHGRVRSLGRYDPWLTWKTSSLGSLPSTAHRPRRSSLQNLELTLKLLDR